MAINEEDLTPEQKEALVNRYWIYIGKCVISCILYFGFLFFANFTVVLVDELYVHNPMFKFLMCVGGSLLTLTGLRGTIQEHREVLTQKIREIVGHL
jgi:hypothetical protein